jgi:hypothetical protein
MGGEDDDRLYNLQNEIYNAISDDYMNNNAPDLDLWKVFSKMHSTATRSMPKDELEPVTRRYDYKSMAETLMRELVANEIESHVLLKDDDIRDWWTGILKEEKRKAEEEARKEAARIKKENDKKLKEDVLSRLTAEEKRVLGLTK